MLPMTPVSPTADNHQTSRAAAPRLEALGRECSGLGAVPSHMLPEENALRVRFRQRLSKTCPCYELVVTLKSATILLSDLILSSKSAAKEKVL